MITEIPCDLRDELDKKRDMKCNDYGSLAIELFNEGEVYEGYKKKGSILDYQYRCVENVGGYEKGPVFYKVIEFRHDQKVFYIKFYGWYDSYEGSTFNGYKLVEPKQKIITVYEDYE